MSCKSRSKCRVGPVYVFRISYHACREYVQISLGKSVGTLEPKALAMLLALMLRDFRCKARLLRIQPFSPLIISIPTII